MNFKGQDFKQVDPGMQKPRQKGQSYGIGTQVKYVADLVE